MGLDLVELVMRVEEEFGLEIPDEDAERLETPRHVADYVCSRVDLVPAEQCLTAVEFYRLRAAMRMLGVSRRDVRPRVSFSDVFPDSELARSWTQLETTLAVRRWPKLQHPSFRPKQLSYPRGCETVWGLARHLATWNAVVPTGPDAAWTAETVLLRVRQITGNQLGIKSFNDDDYYVRDLHVD